METFIGQIQAFGFNFATRVWSKCEGQLLPISQNTALFSLIGTTYGGDGRTTFALPDLRARSIVGIGNGPGLDTISWGQRGGNVDTTLTTQNLASHNHSVSVGVNKSGGEEDTPVGQVISSHSEAFNENAQPGQLLGGVSQANVGNSQAFSNRSPFLGINVCIALTGIFPSRN
jgi:microcystin-dependent protein